MQPGRAVWSVAVLALALVLLMSGCKRRDELAEPDLQFDKPIKSLLNLDQPSSDETVEVDPQPPAAPPVEAPAPAQAPSFDLHQALKHASSFYVTARTVAGRSVPGVRVGLALVTHDHALVSESWLDVDGQTYARAAQLSSGDLLLWRRSGDSPNAPDHLCESAPPLGDELALVGPGDSELAFAVRVAYPGQPLAAEGALSDETRLLALNLPAIPQLAGSLLVDRAGRVCGIVTASALHGLASAIGPDELRLWQRKAVEWQGRYPQAIPAMAQAEPTDDTPQAEPPPVDTENTPMPSGAPVAGAPPALGEKPIPTASAALWLGAVVENLSPALRVAHKLPASAEGLYVKSVHAQSPAQYAGMRSGDLLLTFEQTPVQRVAQLPELMARTTEGQVVTVSVLRDGAPVTLQPVVARRP
jgi:hypothetical protein